MEINSEGSRARIVGRQRGGRYFCPALATARRPRLRRAAALQSRSAGRRDAWGRSAAAAASRRCVPCGRRVRCDADHLRRCAPTAYPSRLRARPPLSRRAAARAGNTFVPLERCFVLKLPCGPIF